MPPPDAWQFEAIGTAWQIDTATPLDDDIRTEVLERIDEFDRVWSRFRADSLVSEMATRSGSWEVPDAEDLLGFYDELYEACLLYTSPSPRDRTRSRMPSSA